MCVDARRDMRVVVTKEGDQTLKELLYLRARARFRIKAYERKKSRGPLISKILLKQAKPLRSKELVCEDMNILASIESFPW